MSGHVVVVSRTSSARVRVHSGAGAVYMIDVPRSTFFAVSRGEARGIIHKRCKFRASISLTHAAIT